MFIGAVFMESVLVLPTGPGNGIYNKMMTPLAIERRRSSPDILSLDVSKLVSSPVPSRKLPRRSKTFIGALRVGATTLHRLVINNE